MSLETGRVYIQCLVIVLHCATEIILAETRQGAVHIRRAAGRHQVNGLVKVGLGRFIVTRNHVHHRARLIHVGRIPVALHSLPHHLFCHERVTGVYCKLRAHEIGPAATRRHLKQGVDSADSPRCIALLHHHSRKVLPHLLVYRIEFKRLAQITLGTHQTIGICMTKPTQLIAARDIRVLTDGNVKVLHCAGIILKIILCKRTIEVGFVQERL